MAAFLVRAFYGEKNKTFQLILPAERIKAPPKNIPEEENGLERERAHARHLDLRLYALIQCATYILTLSATYF